MNQEIVTTARGWVGTRFHHQGRLKKSDKYNGGVDCLGLLLGVAKELKLPFSEYDEVSYSHYPDTEKLRTKLAGMLQEIPKRNIEIGDILLLSIDGNPQHLAIVGETCGELSIENHVAGERFVLLDGAIDKKVISNNIIGLSRKYKPVTVGSNISSVTAQDFTYTGIALKPYSPVQINGVRDGSGNLTISWVRRSRIGGEWRDNVDVPLNEVSELYEVDIMDGSNVLRNIIGLTNPTATYSASEQIVDFGSLQASVSVNIYQISGAVGRGYAGLAEV